MNNSACNENKLEEATVVNQPKNFEDVLEELGKNLKFFYKNIA